MKKDIHPKLYKTQVVCSCGYSFETLSAAGEKITVEICSNCHPFFTGQQKFVDTAGRIDRFKRKYAKFQKNQKKK